MLFSISTDRSSQYASPNLWNELFMNQFHLFMPISIHPSLIHFLCPSLKTHLLGKSFPP